MNADVFELPEDLRYTPSHLWVRVDGDVATVGLTNYGQDQFGKVFFVGLPAVGSPASFGMPVGYLQSAGYGLTQLFPPVQGAVEAINEDLWAQPGLVNEQPFEDGWLLTIKMDDPSELDELESPERYRAMLNEDARFRRPELPTDWRESDQPAFLIDEQRRIMNCNEAAENLFGLRRRAIWHRPLCAELFGCHHDNTGDPVRKSDCPGMCSMLNLEPVDSEYVVVNAQGDETKVRAHYTPFARPGQPRCAIVTMQIEED